MNKTMLAIIGGVVVLGGAFFLLGSGGNDMSHQSGSSSADDNGGVPKSFNGTLTELRALGKNVTCTFSQDDEEMRGGGTIYVSGDQMRGDFQMEFKGGGGSMNASMIQKDGVGYSWGDSPFGTFATKVNLEDEDNDEEEQPVDFDEELDYNCARWKVDDSKFELPAEVNFDDINAEVQQIQEGEAMLQGAQCEACDQIPDPEGQAQCREMMGC